MSVLKTGEGLKGTGLLNRQRPDLCLPLCFTGNNQTDKPHSELRRFALQNIDGAFSRLIIPEEPFTFDALYGLPRPKGEASDYPSIRKLLARGGAARLKGRCSARAFARR